MRTNFPGLLCWAERAGTPQTTQRSTQAKSCSLNRSRTWQVSPRHYLMVLVSSGEEDRSVLFSNSKIIQFYQLTSSKVYSTILDFTHLLLLPPNLGLLWWGHHGQGMNFSSTSRPSPLVIPPLSSLTASRSPQAVEGQDGGEHDKVCILWTWFDFLDFGVLWG